jgi:hypothetical protein
MSKKSFHPLHYNDFFRLPNRNRTNQSNSEWNPENWSELQRLQSKEIILGDFCFANFKFLTDLDDLDLKLGEKMAINIDVDYGIIKKTAM